jgi:hypothetical protein
MKAVILNISAWMLLPFMDGIAKFLKSGYSFSASCMGQIFFSWLFLALLLLQYFSKHI